MKVGDLVYNKSIEMYGIIASVYPPSRPSMSKLTWYTLLLGDGGHEVANHKELELISESR